MSNQLLRPFFKYIFPSTDKSNRIENRLFEISLFMSIVVFSFWSIYGFIVNYGAFVQSIYVSGVFVFSVLYVIQKKGKHFRILSLTNYYLLLFMLGIAWLPSGGVRAAIPEYIALIFISGLLVLPIKDFLIFILLTFGMVLMLTVYEIYYPNAAATYNSTDLLLQDLTISTLAMLLIAGISLFIFKRAYISDRRELRKKNKELGFEKQKAETTDEAKTTFLATVSHEMRTPLNGIVGMIELLSKTNLDQEQRELLKSLTYSGNILHGLISNVLDITTIEAGKLDLDVKAFEIRKELNSLKAMFQKKIIDKPDIKISLIVEDKIPDIVIGDLARIRQILVNLLNNSLKFTRKGSVSLEVSSANLMGGLLSIKFIVSDTGVGIRQEKQKHLFETFYKASDTDGYEGTGLGLAIVQRLVLLMGGTIDFKSKEGVGSKFYVTLPLGIGEKSEPEGLEKISLEGLDKLRVLIVEDIEINRMVAKKLLKSIGVEQIEIAINGNSGVSKAIQDFYDIIFMDLQMPDISGFEASKQITGFYSDKKERPIIIALTANAMKNSMDECYKVGMSDYVLKPVRSETLKEVLLKYVSSSEF